MCVCANMCAHGNPKAPKWFSLESFQSRASTLFLRCNGSTPLPVRSGTARRGRSPLKTWSPVRTASTFWPWAWRRSRRRCRVPMPRAPDRSATRKTEFRKGKPWIGKSTVGGGRNRGFLKNHEINCPSNQTCHSPTHTHTHTCIYIHIYIHIYIYIYMCVQHIDIIIYIHINGWRSH